MPLRLFKSDLFNSHRRTPYVTVRSDGRLTFNAEGSRALAAADLRRLFGDRRSKRVVVRPPLASPTEEVLNTHLISYLKPTPNQIRVTFEAKPFLCWPGYSFPPPGARNTTSSERGTSATSVVQRYEIHSLPRRSFTFTLGLPELSTPDKSHEVTA